jgi:hypothetical protein
MILKCIGDLAQERDVLERKNKDLQMSAKSQGKEGLEIRNSVHSVM